MRYAKRLREIIIAALFLFSLVAPTLAWAQNYNYQGREGISVGHLSSCEVCGILL